MKKSIYQVSVVALVFSVCASVSQAESLEPSVGVYATQLQDKKTKDLLFADCEQSNSRSYGPCEAFHLFLKVGFGTASFQLTRPERPLSRDELTDILRHAEGPKTDSTGLFSSPYSSTTITLAAGVALEGRWGLLFLLPITVVADTVALPYSVTNSLVAHRETRVAQDIHSVISSDAGRYESGEEIKISHRYMKAIIRSIGSEFTNTDADVVHYLNQKY